MGTPIRVLIVEDSEDDSELVVRELKRGGYDVKCKRVETAAALEAACEMQEWDLVISDFSMPIFSGMEALALEGKADRYAIYIRVRDHGRRNGRDRDEKRR